jgi:hypothetical protein
MIEFWITAALIWLFVSAFGFLFWKFLGWLFGFATRPPCAHCGRALTQNWSCSACENAKLELNPKPAVVHHSMQNDLQAAQRLLQHAKASGVWDAEKIRLITESLALLKPNESVPREIAVTREIPEKASAPKDLPISLRTELKPGNLQQTPKQTEGVQSQRTQQQVEKSAVPPPFEKAAVHPLDEPDDLTVDKSRRSVGREAIRNVQNSARQWTGEMIVAFMEKSNIRWMELVAASLVVFCSVGLVISLWSTLAATSRFFPSIVFMLATLAVHGAGQYTLKKWKLQNTSRGILHIALMLIPLSVMIGILLARGGAAPGQGVGIPMDWQYWTMMLIGIGVYGGLAVTASQSLFTTAWLPVAASTIVSSLSLVLISWGARQSISGLMQAGTLVPSLATVGLFTWFASYRGAVRIRRTFGFYRRQIGMAIQMLFASVAAIVFWNLHHGPILQASPWVWMVLGSFASFWAIWGIVHSDLSKMSIANLKKAGSIQDEKLQVPQRGEETSSAVILSWLIGMMGSVLVLWALWRLADQRWPLLALLGIAGAWQGSLGWVSRNVQAIAGGCFALILAATLGIEVSMMPTLQLTWSDWFSWQRVITLAALGGGVLLLSKQFEDLSHVALGKGMRIAGGLALAVGLILSVVATMVPWGRTPYGGNWGALLVTLYGLAGVGFGLMREVRAEGIRKEWLVGAQILCLLGVHRVFAQATWLPEYCTQWRPGLSTVMGFGYLSAVWASMALGCRWKWGRNAITPGVSWVFGGGIALGILNWVACAQTSRPLDFFLATGWILPLVVIGRWLASAARSPETSDQGASSREAAGFDWGLGYREVGFGLLPIWLTACVHRLIDGTSILERMSVLAKTPLHLGLLSLFAVAISLGLQRAWQVSKKQSLFQPVRYSAGHWWCDFTSLSMVLLTLVVSAGTLCQSMGWGIAKYSVIGRIVAVGQSDSWFLGMGLTTLGVMTVLGLIVSQSEGVSTRRWLWKLTVWLVALIVGTQGTLVWGIGLHPWVATCWLVATLAAGFALLDWYRANQGDLLALGDLPERDTRLGDDANQESLYRGALRFLEMVPLGTVLVLTIVAVSAFVSRSTNSVDPMPWSAAWNVSGFGARGAIVTQWFLPLGLATFVSWLVSIVPVGAKTNDGGNSESSCVRLLGNRSQIFVRGILLALSIALILFAIPKTLGSSSVELGMNLLSALSIGFGLVSLGTSWDWFMKLARSRVVDGSSIALSSAREASEWIGQLAIGCGVGVAMLACMDNIHHAAGVRLLPSNASYQTLVGLSIAVTAYLVSGVQRQRDKRLLGMVLCAVIAPILPLVFSSFLLRGWGTASVVQAAYRAEPLHAMILGWIAALGFGVAIRGMNREGSLRGIESLIWGGLAILSTVLSLWHPAGTPIGWILGLGLGVAAMVLARGLAVGTQWLGHIAAILSAAAISWFLTQRDRGFVAGHQELMLWGPVLCGWVSLIWYLKRPAAETPQGALTVDQSVSILVPIALMLWTGFGVAVFSILSVITSVLRLTMTTTGVSWSAVVLGLGSLGLAILRCWDVRSAMRGWSVYLSTVSVAMSLGATLAGASHLTSVHTFLAWIYGGLIATIVLAVCLREWLRESTRLLPALHLGSLAPKLDDFAIAGKRLSGLHSGLGLFVMVLAPVMVLSGFDVTTARLASLLPILSALSILPLAIDEKYRFPRVISLALISVAVILLSWSDLIVLRSPTEIDSWVWWRGNFALGIAQRTFIAIVALSLVYRLISSRYRGWLDWDVILERGSVVLMVAGTVFGWGYIVGLWGAMRGAWPGASALSLVNTPWTIGVGSFIAWTLLAWSWLRTMFSPDSKGVSNYVYLITSESCIIASLLILQMHFPWLFSGWIAQWWPIIVYGLAFGSIAIGEWLRRAGRESIADPIERQSILLPVIPILATLIPKWSLVGSFWSQPISLSLLLLISGVAYMVIGNYRKWTILKSIAMLLFLGAFWSMLHSQDHLKLMEHPQLWLIPPALATLVFVERNRDELAGSVVTGMRYMGLLVIYMSSSVEMIFKSFELQFWAPVVLLSLAVAGILVGVGVRIRAFLYCGSWFVFVALFGMVWQAQRAIGQVWPWWVFGIFMGVGLIALIGYFEKNRAKFLKMVASLKEWQA